MRRYSLALIALALSLSLASPGAHAESTSKRLDDIDDRLDKIERILSNQSLLELSQRMDQMQTEVRQLRGRVEELENTVQQQQAQQKKQQRAAAAPPPPPPVTAPPPQEPAAAPAAAAAVAGTALAANTPRARGPSADADVTVDQTVYTQAMDALKAGSYSVAQVGFKDFVANYPTSPLAPNAQYWLAKSYDMTSNREAAVAAYRKVLSQWPEDRKAPDAMFGLAVTLQEMGKAAEGRALLLQVTQKYPGTDAARQAAERLARKGK